MNEHVDILLVLGAFVWPTVLMIGWDMIRIRRARRQVAAAKADEDQLIAQFRQAYFAGMGRPATVLPWQPPTPDRWNVRNADGTIAYTLEVGDRPGDDRTPHGK